MVEHTPDEPGEAAEAEGLAGENVQLEGAGATPASLSDAICAHVDAFIGPIADSWQEQDPERLDLRILRVPPSPSRPFWTLVSVGMSCDPMRPPEEYSGHSYAELMLCLPQDWPMEDEHIATPEGWWPIAVMRWLAGLPRQHDAWIWLWHTIGNGNPPQPFDAATPMAGVLLIPPVLLDPAHHIIHTPDRNIQLMGVVFLHPAELVMRDTLELDDLLALLGEFEVSELLEPHRPCYYLAPPAEEVG